MGGCWLTAKVFQVLKDMVRLRRGKKKLTRPLRLEEDRAMWKSFWVEGN